MHESDWLVDSGASKHLYGDKTTFMKLNTVRTGRSVQMADGRQVPIVGKGEVTLGPNIRLIDVLFVPDFLLAYYL